MEFGLQKVFPQTIADRGTVKGLYPTDPLRSASLKKCIHGPPKFQGTSKP